jgi:hypothetical protein
VAYWGDFGIVKVQVGVFDGESLNSAGGQIRASCCMPVA